MRRSRHTPRQLFGLTLTLVGLLSWHILPIPHPELAVRAANRVRGAEPTGQPVSRGVMNGRVAFVSGEGQRPPDIYTMNPDGSDRKQLTFSQEYEDGPVWSPDGTKIAFQRYEGGIFVMNADGSDQRRLTQSNSVYDRYPTWSSDGTKIAFWRLDTTTMPYSTGIFVMNADGSDQRAVASSSSLYEPAWSPDGLKFALKGAGGLAIGIYLINVDGSNRTRITQPPTTFQTSFVDYNPAWSPDGSKITFIRCEYDGLTCYPSHLWGVNADGSNPTKLSDTIAYSHAWSPDGTKIIVSNGDLLVMNPDGSGLTNITNTNGQHEFSPSWQALPLTQPNPIDDPQFFVRQQYRDFLNREPEQQGLTDWLAILNNCPAGSIQCDRIEVSSGFFRSPEFRQRGYFPYRFYNVSLGRIPTFAEFMPDLARVSGFLTEAEMEHARQGFIQDFMSRPGFTSIYNELSNNDYVQKLFDTAGLSQITIQGSVQTVATMQQAMANEGKSRAQVLREIVESAEVDAKYYVQAFVVMQYFGYLRRDPDALYLDWITTMQGDPNNYRQMVNGFMNSIEYRSRFGSP